MSENREQLVLQEYFESFVNYRVDYGISKNTEFIEQNVGPHRPVKILFSDYHDKLSDNVRQPRNSEEDRDSSNRN